MTADAFDRRRGALVGLAVGDALGAAVEFKPPGSFEVVTGYRGGGPHSLGPGEWTDDSSMALALADSILDTGWDLADQARRYLDWYRNGSYSVNGTCFDIGIATSRALGRFGQSGDPRTSGLADPRSAGNGSIMRLAPVPAGFIGEGLQRVVELSVDSSLPTHRAPQCLSACAVLGAIIGGLIEGRQRAEVLDPDGEVLSTARHAIDLEPEMSEVVAGSYLDQTPPEIRGSGYVVRSLEAALWAFVHNDDFESAVLAAVNLGDDADTTGAVCGQLAGAYWGFTGIPSHLRNSLARLDYVDGFATRLASR